ncbi:MAG: hypothetical protein ABI565_04200 [Vicinamibacteria bacterium]
MMSTKYLGLILGAVLATACGAEGDRVTAAHIEKLKAEYGVLHQRFEKAAGTDPLVTSAFQDRGRVIVAIRSGLIEELAGNIAARYLDHVTVDLANVTAHGSGKLDKKTFLGAVTLGEWKVSVILGDMKGHLRAAQPTVSLRPPDLIDISLPVDVEETLGEASLHFEWDSSGVANAVCKDFQTTQAIKGRVLPQRHILQGALQLRNLGGRLTESPLFPNRHIQLQLDLTKESWADLERTLRAEDTLGKCGMFMKPADVLNFLRELGSKGIGVHLPDSIFRAVDLPARLQESALVNQRPIGLRLSAESLRVDTATLWSSVSVQVLTRPTPQP